MPNDDISALAVRLAELERKVEFILNNLNLTYIDNTLSLAETEAAKWLKLGDKNKMEAIKAYRQVTGVGLQEAMKAIEALEVKLAMRR